jgi:peptidyl-prolyl cis-trans isomerase D
MALAAMRRHRRWLYGFLWIVILAFVILYVPALTDRGQGTPAETLVDVGGLKVSLGEYQRAYNRQKQYYSQMYQGRLDENMIRQLGLEGQVLDTLVSERLVALEAKRLGIAVPDEAVARAIATSPDFQDAGKFIGKDEIRRRLELAGMSEDDLELSLRQRIERESLEALIGAGVQVSDAEVEREFRKRTEQLRLEYVQVDSARYKAAVSPTDDEVKARFESKRDSYKIPEKRVLSYVLLDRPTLQPQVAVTDRELEVFYNDRREDYRQQEEACAGHILVKVKQGDAAEGHTDADAKALAQKALDQLKAGADFATLAKKVSEDTGSAAQGGDLGCFQPGRMVPEFDDAVFALEPGGTSELVKTQFGYHVIRLVSKKDATVQPFAEVKERIRASLLDRKVVELGEQKSQALADALAHKKTLEEAAKAQGLTVQKSAPFARGELPPGLASPTVVARAFQLKQGEPEKEGFSVAQGAVFIALAEVQPARGPELQDVKERVRGELVDEAALAKAHETSVELRAKAESAGLEKAASALQLVRKETPSLTGRGQPLGDLGTGLALEEAAFSLPEKTLSAPVRTLSGWALLRVLEKKPFDAAEFDRQKAALRAGLRQQRQSELFRAFLIAARDRYEISRNAEAYKRALGQEQ